MFSGVVNTLLFMIGKRSCIESLRARRWNELRLPTVAARCGWGAAWSCWLLLLPSSYEYWPVGCGGACRVPPACCGDDVRRCWRLYWSGCRCASLGVAREAAAALPPCRTAATSAASSACESRASSRMKLAFGVGELFCSSSLSIRSMSTPSVCVCVCISCRRL